MHVEKTIQSETEVTLVITAVTEDLAPYKQKVLEKLAPSVKVPGFRGGKVPPQLVEKHVDPSLLQTEFLDEALTGLYAAATQQESVRPVTQPAVDIKKFVPFTTLEFEVKTHVIGEIKLGKYKGLKTSIPDKKVTEADVAELLETLRTRMSEKKPVERAAKKGDEAVIDFKGVDTDKKPIKGADGNDYPLTLGSNQFIPGFEDNLTGMKTGEEKAFTLTFPKDYGVKALANKKVSFTVTIKTINELAKPELTDEFAALTGPFKTLDELKVDIKKQLENEAAQGTLRDRQNDVLKQVADKSSVAIPQPLIDQQVTYEIDELRRNLTYRGQTYQEYLESEGTTEEALKKNIIGPKAADQVKVGIVLSEIAEKENLNITPEELEMQMQGLASQYQDPQMQAQLQTPEARRDIASRMLSEKVVNFIVSHTA